MGANLVPILEGFHIENAAADSSSITDSMKDNCVSHADHRLLRFDMLTYNKGDADFNVGRPVDHPENFVFSAAHGHFHNIDFNEYSLFNEAGQEVVTGAKQGFCLEDVRRIDPRAALNSKFSCDFAGLVEQGVQPGWADVYSSGLACQFVVIDGVPDGYYRLRATTNARFAGHEDTYVDNSIVIGLELQGNTVVQVTEQQNWRWCHKCQGLYFAGNATQGICPTGGAHDHAGSGDYILANNTPGALGQQNWRWCHKCQGLYFAGNATQGICPTGGAHDHAGSGNYTLVQNIPGAFGQANWRWCNKCQGLAFAGGNPSLGPCPAGGTHDHAGSGDALAYQV
jgi:hypothetical protein